MRKFLAAFAVTALMTTSAMAGHLGVPTVGQERAEHVFVCLQNLEAARMITQTQKFKDEGQSASIYIDHVNALISDNKCRYINVRYKVVEIVESRNGPVVTGEKVWGKIFTQYVLKIKGSTSDKTYYAATY